MKGFIDNYNFKEMPAQKYWAPPASWSFEKKKETQEVIHMKSLAELAALREQMKASMNMEKSQMEHNDLLNYQM